MKQLTTLTHDNNDPFTWLINRIYELKQTTLKSCANRFDFEDVRLELKHLLTIYYNVGDDSTKLYAIVDLWKTKRYEMLIVCHVVNQKSNRYHNEKFEKDFKFNTDVGLWEIQE